MINLSKEEALEVLRNQRIKYDSSRKNVLITMKVEPDRESKKTLEDSLSVLGAAMNAWDGPTRTFILTDATSFAESLDEAGLSFEGRGLLPKYIQNARWN